MIITKPWLSLGTQVLKSSSSLGSVTWVIFGGGGRGFFGSPETLRVTCPPNTLENSQPAAAGFHLGSIFMLAQGGNQNRPQNSPPSSNSQVTVIIFFTSGLPNTNWQLLLVPMVLPADCYLVEVEFFIFFGAGWGNPSGFWGFLSP